MEALQFIVKKENEGSSLFYKNVKDMEKEMKELVVGFVLEMKMMEIK